MNKEDEQKVIEVLYERLYDAVTYAPAGKGPVLDKSVTYFQLAKNQVLDPTDFANMLSPTNPEGSLASAQAFSAFVDALPNPDPLWADSGKRLSDVYENLITRANTDTVPDPEQMKIYERAYKYLNTEKVTKDMNGKTRTKIEPSQSASDYDDAQAAYVTAVMGYRSAYLGYTLTNVKDQRAFAAVAPGLQLNIDQSWNKWLRADKAEVEQAQAALASTLNDALRDVIEKSRKLVEAQYKQPSTDGVGPDWLMSYALPSTFALPDTKASKLTLKSSNLNKNESETTHSYSAAAEAKWGLWHGSTEVGGEHKNTNAHMDASDFTLEAELLTVNIKRPWFNPALLSMSSWWVTGLGVNGISDGKLGGIMPLIPTAFVVARNVKLTANFSEEDKKFIANAISTKASGGWGPFSISGSYKHGSSKSEFKSKLNGGTLEMPGLQVIAWANTLTPPSPSRAAK